MKNNVKKGEGCPTLHMFAPRQDSKHLDMIFVTKGIISSTYSTESHLLVASQVEAGIPSLGSMSTALPITCTGKQAKVDHVLFFVCITPRGNPPPLLSEITDGTQQPGPKVQQPSTGESIVRLPGKRSHKVPCRYSRFHHHALMGDKVCEGEGIDRFQVLQAIPRSNVLIQPLHISFGFHEDID